MLKDHVASEELKSKSILLVDDEADLLEVIQDILGLSEIVVDTASSGHQALSKMETAHYDIIISDVKMPDGSGVDLLQSIRAKDPDKPVLLFITGQSEISSDELKKMGARDVLTKPIDYAYLIELLEDLAQNL